MKRTGLIALGALFVGGSLIVILCAWFIKFRISEKVMFETNEVGRVLVLFVQDFGKMPRNMDELFAKGYLVKKVDAVIVAGPKTKNRFVEGTVSFEGVHLQFLDKIKIQFDARSGHGNVITVPADFPGAARWAKFYSEIIEDSLARRH